MSTPKISVLMPVYNAAPFLAESIKSILAQSFADFEFLISDDGSDDDSLAIIKKYAARDKRVTVLDSVTKAEQAKCRNILLERARADFIAWMDADDFSLPNRLAVQYDFLQRNPDIDMIGGSGAHYKHNFRGKPIGYTKPATGDHEIKSQLLLLNPFVHSSAMLRAKKVRRHSLKYNLLQTCSLDYKFWVDSAPHCKFANLEEVLVKVRVHPKQIGQRLAAEQRSYHLQISQALLSNFNIKVSERGLRTVLGWDGAEQDLQATLVHKRDIFEAMLNVAYFYSYSAINREVIVSELVGRVYQNFDKRQLPAIRDFWRGVFASREWGFLNEKSYLWAIKGIRHKAGLGGVWAFAKNYGVIRLIGFFAAALLRRIGIKV